MRNDTVEQQARHGEQGFVLVLAMVVLLMLTLIGLASLSSSNLETMVASNDWAAKRALYKSESGLEMGIEALEYNFSCGPFTAKNLGGDSQPLNLLTVDNSDLKFVERAKVERDFLGTHGVSLPHPQYPGDAERQLCWASSDPFSLLNNPANPVYPTAAACVAGAAAEHTNIGMHGEKVEDAGEANPQGGGYAGIGASPGGSVSYHHQIYARNINNGGSGAEATLRAHWRHKGGREDAGICR